MTNLERNEKINKIIKRALMVVLLLAVQFVMFEINMPKTAYARTNCSSCDVELSNGCCSKCGKWECPGCDYTTQRGYVNKCSICSYWWGESNCSRSSCNYPMSRGHYCCTANNWDNSINHIASFSGIHSDHSFDQYVSGTTGSCTENGNAVYACSHIVNNEQCRAPNQTVATTALGHNYVNNYEKEASSATCTIPATYYKKCSNCGDYSSDTCTGSALGHSYTEKNTGSNYVIDYGDCETAASYYFKCSRCAAKGSEIWYGEIGGHDFTGKDNLYLVSTGTCKTPHTWNYNCTICDAKGSGTYTSGYGNHSWGDYSVTTVGNCTTAEIETRTCSLCDKTDSRNNGTKDIHNDVNSCDCGATSVVCSRCSRVVYHTALKPTTTSAFTYDGSAKTAIPNKSYYTRGGTYSATNAGSYSGTYTLNNTTKHLFAGSQSSITVNWSIASLPLALTAVNKSKTYGENDPTFTISATGQLSGQTPAYSSAPTRNAGENVGTYTITVGTGIALADNSPFLANNYYITSRNSGTFTINAKAIDTGDGETEATNIDVTWNAPDVTYDGNAHKPTPIVVYNAPNGTKTLTEGTDYTVEYSNYINVGTSTITITARGNYSGSLKKEFSINRRTITVTPNSLSKKYGEKNPIYTYTNSGAVSTQTPKFTGTLSRTAGETVGTYSVLQNNLALTDNGTFKASNHTLVFDTSKVFTINTKPISDTDVIEYTWDNPTYIYSGFAHEPTITIKHTKPLNNTQVTLTAGTDFTYEYANNVNVGTSGTVTVTGKGNYSGTLKTNLKIIGKDIDDSTIVVTLKDSAGRVVTDATYTYNGDQKKPTVVVVDNENGNTLVQGVDYTVAYENNINAYPASHTTVSPVAVVTGIGNYSDENRDGLFKINRKSIRGTTLTLFDAAGNAVTTSTYEYNMDEKKPTIRVYDNERGVYLTKDSDYTVAYTNNVDAYPAPHTTVAPRVTVTGINNYNVDNSITFEIKRKPITKTTYSLNTTEYIYNGAENKPTATVIDNANNVEILQNKDYSLSYTNNINANADGYSNIRSADPIPTTTITGINNYIDSVTRTFRIDAKKIEAQWQDKDKFVYNFGQQAPYATAITGVAGETANIITTKNTDPAYYTSRAAISSITGGQARVLNYELTNVTKDYGIYMWPTVPPTIKYIDENGNDITFIDDNVGPYDISTYPTIEYVVDPTTGKKVRAWYNQDIDIQVSGSTLNGTPGEVGYMFHFDVNPDDTNVPEEYEYYDSKVILDLLGETAPNQQYKYDSHTGSTNFHAEDGVNNIYFKSYNTHYQEDEVSKLRTESGEVSRYITKIEKTKPTMEISSNKTWSKSHTATITLADVGGSHLLEKTYTLQYSWTQSKDTPAVYDHSTQIVVARGTDIATTTITKDTDYGVWYLHVKLTEKLEDNATNFIDGADVVMYGEFWMDNKAPIITLEKNHELAILDKTDVYTINFEVVDEHVGIDTSEFTESDIEILLQPDNTESTATKKLTHLSTTQRDGLDVHLYQLEITNITETGYFIMRIKADRLKDKLGNGNEVTVFLNDEIGLTGDNEIPTIALTGPIEVKSITEGRNLSGVIDDRYINQEYEISMPIEVTDVGIIDIIDGLQTTDLTTFVGGILVDPMVKITLDKEEEVENSVTHVKTFTKKYTLTYSGIRNDGYLFVVFNDTAVSDDTELKNVTTSLRPYSIVNEMKYFTYVDNTTPRITLLNADTLQNINKDAEIVLNLKLTDDGAGIRGTGPETFEGSDIIVQIDGADVIVSKKLLVADEGNDYNSVLGNSVDVNYTYVLTIQGIRKDGTLRIAIPGGNVIDKANNASEAITLETNIVLDNQGPKLGPITTNADANHQVFGGDVEIKIEGCYDENEIASYVWQKSENGVEWVTIKFDETNSSTSSVTDETPEDGRYYYRVIVTDTVGNSTTSEEVFVDYFTSILSIPIIRLEQESKGVGVVEITGTITSTLPIEKVTVNGNEIAKSKLTEKINRYQITTTFTYEATSNGVYTFIATDTNGNTAQESINVNLVDGTNAVITAKPSDATIFSDAQIVFTANEPVRIINPNGYEGITFDTSDFTTTIVATISKDVDYEDTEIFKFENKALLKTDVEVPPPIITKLQYLRFSRITSPMLGITIKRANILVNKMGESKVLSDGKIVSYYGFDGAVNVNISTNADLNAAINLGNANKVQFMDSVGKPVELTATVESSVKATENSNYTNGNMSGMYKSGGTMEPTAGILEDNTTTYNAFRTTIRVK